MSRSAVRSPAPPSPPVAELDALVELARRFGSDPDFARGGGGNASVKVGGILYIKPSGIPLATLVRGDLVALDLVPLQALLTRDSSEDDPVGTDPIMRAAAAARLGSGDGRRPSVELLFHASLPERFVLHTHPILLNGICCSRDGAGFVERSLGDRALWVPYADPGLPLARAVADARRAYERRSGRAAPSVILMQNHGIIIAAETAEKVVELTDWLVATAATELERTCTRTVPVAQRPAAVDPALARGLVDTICPTLRAVLANGDLLRIVTFDAAPAAADFVTTPAGRALVEAGPLTPDQIVYAGSWPLVVDLPGDLSADDLRAADLSPMLHRRVASHVAARGSSPTVVIVPGLGLFAAGDTWIQADTARHIYLDALRVGQLALRLGGPNPLSDAQRSFIETWEAEAYRRGVAAGARAGGRFAGKVAVVTGGARGFGLAIASDLVAQGGHVVLADTNAPLAEANATELEERFGSGRAFAVAMDLGDDRSVADGFHAVAERYGGLDLLVSNAGVLLAGSVVSQPLEAFDLVTRVNYRGYFLAVRSAAPIMARQHRAKPDYWSDIIEVNSKSGLVGSSRNSAYAGSKFGGIGLTQSFALELMGDGIKVNAVCPGNFFEGPLWADPENGLFIQYLREGKVPGAKTVDDVRRYYEAKVPMGRGCTPPDVLEAIYYLIAQRYETGQALPVTGGQVMLS